MTDNIDTEPEEDDPWAVTDLIEKTVPWKGSQSILQTLIAF